MVRTWLTDLRAFTVLSWAGSPREHGLPFYGTKFLLGPNPGPGLETRTKGPEAGLLTHLNLRTVVSL